MLSYPNIDPVALSLGPLTVGDSVIGPLEIHWYGIMYLLGFAMAWFMAVRNSQRPWSPIKKAHVEDVIVYGAWGLSSVAGLAICYFTVPTNGSMIPP